MFCNQCEQTSKGTGCVLTGVCGKDPQTALLQDLLVHCLTGIAVYADKARAVGVRDADVDRFIIEGLFTTVTNVNFDPQKIASIIRNSRQVKGKIQSEFLKAHRQKNGKDFDQALPKVAQFEPAEAFEAMVAQAAEVGLLADPTMHLDIRSLKQLMLYGLKGTAAYADHAMVQGKTDEEVAAGLSRGLAAYARENIAADELIAEVMHLGKVNLRCMEILDQAHNERFGHPAPAPVSLGVKKGPAILVSGHDLPDLEELLKQTQGKGINIYTHSEMLPAHGYPMLNKYKHLAGNYGGAWQDQAKEFDRFPGAILMTTNCIQEPRETYKSRIFTTGLVAWPGLRHIETVNGKKDFSPVIKAALESAGFAEDAPAGQITVGFGHHAVMGVAGAVIDAVKAGQIKRFFLIGGCDGAKSGRNYYTDFAAKVPKDCVILTLACGKYRFNKMDFGTIGGIPRLLDIGQCNDAYSAVQIALALAKAFNCTVNELPLSLVLSWYEQKAVCILLTLLSLGIKNIRLGPSLPAFVSPGVLKVLVENFDIKPITTVEADLQATLAGN
ncbi:MAG: hydroxylamine reductase [Candidatus Omnitrophota bacterium]